MREVYTQSKYFGLFSVELSYDFSTVYFFEKLHEFRKLYEVTSDKIRKQTNETKLDQFIDLSTTLWGISPIKSVVIGPSLALYEHPVEHGSRKLQTYCR